MSIVHENMPAPVTMPERVLLLQSLVMDQLS